MKWMHLTTASFALLCSLTSVSAQQLTNAELEAMFKDSTHYIEFTGDVPATGKGQGVVYSNGDKVSAKFPNGRTAKGTRVNKDNTTCIQWEGAPPGGCSKFVKKGDTFEIIGVDKGELRGTVTKSAAGNPEKL